VTPSFSVLAQVIDNFLFLFRMTSSSSSWEREVKSTSIEYLFAGESLRLEIWSRSLLGEMFFVQVMNLFLGSG